ncbi:Mss1p [Sporobolomyces salmoneus]|uniref:Mss1p n=1 Tax=Sporobolomyces salmoneus TaxID=183962 RepID=UPI00317E984C
MLRAALRPLCNCPTVFQHPPLKRIRLGSTSASSQVQLPTIFASASGKGRSAIQILRISGDDALEVWRKMTVSPKGQKQPQTDPNPRSAILRKVVHPQTREILDEGVVLYFPRESSLTAQPTLELHLHGSPALMSLMLQLLPTLSKRFRMAEPGEFTRLAFEAGKMDLTEVEGIRDLVDADTEAQRKLAARQASGQMRQAYDSMRATAIEGMALVEALVDFGEDEGISEGVFDQAREKVTSLRDQISKYLDDGRRGEIIRTGIHLAIVGPPNSGKSTTLNWLAQREAAIVTAIPGTTRDVVELSLDFHGFPILVADTAGLRATKDQVEAIGIERALAKADVADIKLCIFSLEQLFPDSASRSQLEPHIDPLTLDLIDSSTLILLNKTDSFLPTKEHLEAISKNLSRAGKNWIGKGKEREFWPVSVKEGTGLKEFAAGLMEELKARYDLSDDLEETPIVTHERHRRHLEECRESLNAFLDLGADDLVDAGEELRYAVVSLGRISGVVDVEEVLGEIFAGFCIGK